jgi:adenylate cyclase
MAEKSPDKPAGLRRLAAALKRADRHATSVAAARALRKRLPGDDRYGDPLSVGGHAPPELLGARLALLAGEAPSALKELGFGALQVWQSVSEAQGRGHGDRELTILFTDLAGFSSWALDVGDDPALELLRAVGAAVEPCVGAHGGQVVKRLGDGLMAVFEEPGDAVSAACAARRNVAELAVADHRPQLRAGLHVGRPRRLGGDYFGVDVNVAARIADAAGPGEVLVSRALLDRLDDGAVTVHHRRTLSAKGAPAKTEVLQVDSLGRG